MSTTSASLGRAAVAAVVEAGVPAALLHDTELPKDGEPVSDIDLVVGTPPSTILSLAAPSWAASGLFPIIAWPYDVGGTMSVFLATADAYDGVQLDMLHDLSGRGRYGIRSGEALGLAVDGPDMPVVPELARMVYLWRKRTEKGDDAALQELRIMARSLAARELREVAVALTGATRVADEMLGRAPVRRTSGTRMFASRIRRALPRLRRPVGFWAHTVSRTVADDLHGRLSRFLDPVSVGPLPGIVTRPLWYLARVAPVRYRPGVFISHGPASSRRADAIVGQGPDAAARRLIEGMNRRLIS